jgi:hypothetical protein
MSEDDIVACQMRAAAYRVMTEAANAMAGVFAAHIAMQFIGGISMAFAEAERRNRESAL